MRRWKAKEDEERRDRVFNLSEVQMKVKSSRKRAYMKNSNVGRKGEERETEIYIFRQALNVNTDKRADRWLNRYR